MLALLVLLVAASPEDPDDREVALFTAPMPVVGSALLSDVTNRNPLVLIPIGVKFTAAQIEWTVDAAFVSVEPHSRLVASMPGGKPLRRGEDLLGYAGFWLACGPTIHAGQQPLRGVFFTPKVTLGVFRIRAPLGAPAGGALEASDRQTMFSFMLGGDFGYQMTVGRVYLALIIGASIGAGWGENDGWAGPWINTGQSVSLNKSDAVFGINLDLLRVGFTF